jgi:ribosome-associated translation inhibitor RaiA
MKASRTEKPPFYIVGLPSEPLEAAEAQLKFERVSADLSKAFPYVEEVRAVVKSKKQVGAHARYEVSVEVYTPRQTFAFSESGYNLASVFDALAPKMKRLLGSRQSRVTGSHGDSARKENL